MIPSEYCQNLVARQGSSLYYSTWPLAKEQRSAIITLYALSYSLNEIPYQCSENYVARSKIQWWRSEIERTFANKPTHPISIGLKEVLKNFSLPKEEFYQWIDDIEYYALAQAYPDEAALNTYLEKTSHLEYLALAINRDAPELYFKCLTLALQKINKICNLKKEIHYQRIPFTESDLKQINPESFKKTTNDWYPILKKQADKARFHYQQGCAALTSIEPLHCHIMANLYLQRLAKIERAKFNILQQSISLVPLSKLWITWRCIRHYKTKKFG